MISRRQLIQLASACAVSALVPTVLAQTKAKRLLLVHGRAQQGKDPVVLKKEWISALTLGAKAAGLALPNGLDVAFPYYGDALDKFTREYDIPLTSDIQAKGRDSIDENFLVFQAQVAEEVRQKAGVTETQVDSEYGANPREKGPLNWEWVQATLRAIDKYGGGISQKTLEQFTRDAFLYTTRITVQKEIDRIIANELTEEPTVVVAHSLGSIVTYHVLSSDPRPLKVPLHVTLGSPLGIRAVRDRFKPLRFPPPAKAWYNAFDNRDVVALYPLDDGNFYVRPKIENNNTVKNHTDNRHGIVGYLDDSHVAKKILESLSS
jgi:hypothetical protein